MKGCCLRPMTIEDYPAVTALWAATEGMGLSADDSAPAIARFLQRNPDLSVVALDAQGQLAGAVLCGHDGRRGTTCAGAASAARWYSAPSKTCAARASAAATCW